MMVLPPFHSVLEYNWRLENMARPSKNSDRWHLCRIVGGVIVIGPVCLKFVGVRTASHRSRRYDDVEGEDSEEGKRSTRRMKEQNVRCVGRTPNATPSTYAVYALRRPTKAHLAISFHIPFCSVEETVVDVSFN